MAVSFGCQSQPGKVVLVQPRKKHPWHKSLSGKRSPSQEVLSDTGLCQLIEPQIGVTYEDKKLYVKKVKGSVHCHHEVDVK